MVGRFSIVFSLALTLLVACGRGTQDADRSHAQPDNEMLSLVNEARAKGAYCGSAYYEGTTPVSWNDSLASAAKGHADEMHDQRYFDHTGLDGSGVGERVSAQGYSWNRVGENIARGQTSVASVVADWIESEGHCKNLMNPRFTQMGGSQAGSYWVQVFANPSR